MVLWGMTRFGIAMYYYDGQYLNSLEFDDGSTKSKPLYCFLPSQIISDDRPEKVQFSGPFVGLLEPVVFKPIPKMCSYSYT